RESSDGFDGTWVAHPDLVSVAGEIFDGVLADRPNQKERQREDVRPNAEALRTFYVPGGRVTMAGAHTNVDVALQYLEAWLRGQGAVAIHNLMEDAATAEISRSQLWQWVHAGVRLDDGGTMTAKIYTSVRDEILATLSSDASLS